MLELYKDRLVVVPWDFSNLSELALQLTAKTIPGDQIRAVCVLQPPDPLDPAAIWGNQSEEEAEQHALQKFRESHPESDFPGVQFVPMFGDPATQIVNYANDHKAGLIVISSHGRSGVSRWLLGSVAERVVRTASCPTLLLPHVWAEPKESGSNAS